MKRQQRGLTKRKRSLRNIIVISGLIASLFIMLVVINHMLTKERPASKTIAIEKKEIQEDREVTKEETIELETEIIVSTAGDFIIGTDESFGYEGTFVHEADVKGLAHFVGGLNGIFEKDDLTTINLETPLTSATEKATKKFRFKGKPEYAEILNMANVEAVNLANNHTMDYLQQGYEDTLSTLEQYKIDYFGYDHQYVKTIKGVKVGILGYEGWEDTPELRAIVEEGVKKFREQGVAIIIVHYHWGVERQYVPTQSQQTLAHFTIDVGADLIVGHHPHVLQGIEQYKDKFIVYSLGNFMFGGNRNPSDKDTFVFQQTFHVKGDKVTTDKDIDVVPFSISSVSNRNDYRPTMLTGAEAERVKQKIIDVSNQIAGSDWLQFEK